MAKQKQTGRKPAGMKIKKGDTVVVLAGRDRGREGTVIAAYPDRQRVLVNGVNIIRKNTKVNFPPPRRPPARRLRPPPPPTPVTTGARAAPDTNQPARAGYRIEETDGVQTKTRISRASGKDV